MAPEIRRPATLARCSNDGRGGLQVPPRWGPTLLIGRDCGLGGWTPDAEGPRVAGQLAPPYFPGSSPGRLALLPDDREPCGPAGAWAFRPTPRGKPLGGGPSTSPLSVWVSHQTLRIPLRASLASGVRTVPLSVNRELAPSAGLRQAFSRNPP
jgi:hypothetical protein